MYESIVSKMIKISISTNESHRKLSHIGGHSAAGSAGAKATAAGSPSPPVVAPSQSRGLAVAGGQGHLCCCSLGRWAVKFLLCRLWWCKKPLRPILASRKSPFLQRSINFCNCPDEGGKVAKKQFSPLILRQIEATFGERFSIFPPNVTRVEQLYFIKMKNPWQTLDLEVAYDNPWIQVTHRNVLNPAGNRGTYGVVHFKNLAIAIVPLDEEGFTWLVGQFRYTLDRYSWEVPEGGGPHGASPLASAQRELIEETGIRAKTWIEVGELHTSNSVTDERGVIFVAKDLTFGAARPEETEQLEVRRVPFNQAVEMVLSGEITDALSISAILKIKLMMERGML